MYALSFVQWNTRLWCSWDFSQEADARSQASLRVLQQLILSMVVSTSFNQLVNFGRRQYVSAVFDSQLIHHIFTSRQTCAEIFSWVLKAATIATKSPKPVIVCELYDLWKRENTIKYTIIIENECSKIWSLAYKTPGKFVRSKSSRRRRPPTRRCRESKEMPCHSLRNPHEVNDLKHGSCGWVFSSLLSSKKIYLVMNFPCPLKGPKMSHDLWQNMVKQKKKLSGRNGAVGARRSNGGGEIVSSKFVGAQAGGLG